VLIDPIYDEAGQITGYAKVTRDVTDRKRAEEELEETRAALYQSQKMQALGELTGGIAHDFNNLLTVIRGSAELLQRPGLADDKRSRYLASIVDTVDRATGLTNHLLAFGRRQALKPEVVQLNLRLDAFAEMVQRTFGGKYEVVLDVDPDLPLVEADITQLETALLNGAINARDAMPDGGRLTIATRSMAGGDEVCVELADTGSGMDPKVAERAFEPFFTTKEVGRGTGLGLSQIHGFAAQTGGRAELHSRLGEGTKLRLILPRTDKPVLPPAEAMPVASGCAGKRVLLVDDNDQVRQFAQSLLAELGCDVVSAGCGAEALELLGREPVDILFTDVVMPGMSGIDLAGRARALRPDLPVLLASGYSEEVVRAGRSISAWCRSPMAWRSSARRSAKCRPRRRLGKARLRQLRVERARLRRWAAAQRQRLDPQHPNLAVGREAQHVAHRHGAWLRSITRPLRRSRPARQRLGGGAGLHHRATRGTCRAGAAPSPAQPRRSPASAAKAGETGAIAARRRPRPRHTQAPSPLSARKPMSRISRPTVSGARPERSHQRLVDRRSLLGGAHLMGMSGDPLRHVDPDELRARARKPSRAVAATSPAAGSTTAPAGGSHGIGSPPPRP
jgi:CheY-like chemotaxis protein